MTKKDGANPQKTRRPTPFITSWTRFCTVSVCTFLCFTLYLYDDDTMQVEQRVIKFMLYKLWTV